MTKHEAIIYAKVIGCIIFYGLVLVLLGSVCDFVLEGLEDFFYYTLDFNKGVSTFLSYLILLILCCVVFFAIAISVMAIKEKYPGLRPGNIIEFIKKNPKKRKKALETYLASSDEYSRQVADAYHEICDMRSRFSLAFNDEAKESYTDTLVSPEKIHEVMMNIKLGTAEPDRNQLTVLQVTLISISNACWNMLNGGPCYYYRGALNLVGQEYFNLFRYCMERIVETHFVDACGHVWNEQDAKHECLMLEGIISQWG